MAAIMSATPSQEETGVFKQQLVDTAASTCSLSVPRMMQTVPSTEELPKALFLTDINYQDGNGNSNGLLADD